MNYIGSEQFTYNKSTKTFVAEVSELSFRGNLGMGFYIRSKRTGDTRLFLFEGTDRDGEDIAGWRFVCPGEGLRALVIND